MGVGGLGRGTLHLTGLSPDTALSSENQEVIESISVGLISLSGRDINRSLSQSVSSGILYLAGLEPTSTPHFVDVVVDVIQGTLNVQGLTIAEQRQVLSMGKSAAARLGLYSNVDVWTTPLVTVGKQFKKEQKQVIEIIQEGENLQRNLEKVVEELSQEYQTLKTKAAKLELQTASQKRRRLQKQIEQLRYKLLLDEDEELLILLL